jgi:hypothetical protein
LATAGFVFSERPVEAANWKIEIVDQGGVGKYSSMKIDSFGNAHLVYVIDDSNRLPMRYATWDHVAKKWFVMTLAESVGSCSLVLDSKQNPHISYVDAGSGSGSTLRYMYWTGKEWKKVPIQINADVISYYSSIVLDASDNPSISFYEYRGPRDTDFKIRLRNVTLKNGVWQLKTVDSEEGSGKFNAMAIDPLGHMHISYANVGATTAGARYAYWGGEKWKVEIIEGLAENNGQMVGYSSCIVLDNTGTPHVAYVNESQPMLKYAVRKKDHWQVQVVARMTKVGYPDRNSIALDENGTPYISYYDAGRGILQLAYPDGARWVVETVDGNGSGFTSSLQIAKGQIWISYADEMNSGIKVARRDLAPPDKAAVSNVTKAHAPDASAGVAK